MSTDVTDQLKSLMTPTEAEQVGLGTLSLSQQQALLGWAHRVFTLGQHVVAEIDKIKYEGRLIVLTDGYRWSVDSTDAITAEMWSPLDKVVVIEGEMFNLDELEKVQVEEELD